MRVSVKHKGTVEGFISMIINSDIICGVLKDLEKKPLVYRQVVLSLLYIPHKKHTQVFHIQVLATCDHTYNEI